MRFNKTLFFTMGTINLLIYLGLILLDSTFVESGVYLKYGMYALVMTFLMSWERIK